MILLRSRATSSWALMALRAASVAPCWAMEIQGHGRHGIHQLSGRNPNKLWMGILFLHIFTYVSPIFREILNRSEQIQQQHFVYTQSDFSWIPSPNDWNSRPGESGTGIHVSSVRMIPTKDAQSMPRAYVQCQSLFGIAMHCGIAVTLVISAVWGLNRSRFQQKVVV